MPILNSNSGDKTLVYFSIEIIKYAVTGNFLESQEYLLPIDQSEYFEQVKSIS